LIYATVGILSNAKPSFDTGAVKEGEFLHHALESLRLKVSCGFIRGKKAAHRNSNMHVANLIHAQSG
jgi:hypothetical protein